jgi:hypothetical protein
MFCCPILFGWWAIQFCCFVAATSSFIRAKQVMLCRDNGVTPFSKRRYWILPKWRMTRMILSTRDALSSFLQIFYAAWLQNFGWGVVINGGSARKQCWIFEAAAIWQRGYGFVCGEQFDSTCVVAWQAWVFFQLLRPLFLAVTLDWWGCHVTPWGRLE